MNKLRQDNINKLKNYTPYKLLKNFFANEFCQEVAIYHHPKNDWCESYFPEKSKNDKLSNELIEFALADGTGATFAIWLPDNLKIEESPIVYMGEELKVIAQNLEDFLILLSLDDEFGCNIYRDCDEYEESPDHRLYCNWLKNTMHLEPIPNCNDINGEEYPVRAERIINKVQELHQLNFDTWIHNISENSNLSTSEYKAKFWDKEKVADEDETDLDTMSLIELAEYYLLRNDKKAFEYYKKSYIEDRSETKCYEPLAEYYEEDGDYEESLKFYLLSLESDPNTWCKEDSRHLSIQKICKVLNKNYLEICKEIITKSNDCHAHIYLMKSYFQNNLLEEAFEHFKFAYDKMHPSMKDEDYIYWKKQFGIAGMFNRRSIREKD